MKNTKKIANTTKASILLITVLMFATTAASAMPALEPDTNDALCAPAENTPQFALRNWETQEESPLRYQTGDSDFVWALRPIFVGAGQAKPDRRRRTSKSADRILGSVHPAFQDKAKDILADPRKYKSRLNWLLPGGKKRKELLEEAFVVKDLKNAEVWQLKQRFLGEDGAKKYVVIYHRVSTANQAKRGTSLEDNLEALLRKCEDYGFTVAAIAIDVESGGELNRRGLQSAMAAVQIPGIQCMVVSSLSRFTRSQKHLCQLLWELEESESYVLYGRTYMDPSWSLAVWWDADSRFMALQEAYQAECFLLGQSDARARSIQHRLEKGYLVATGRKKPFICYTIRHVKEGSRSYRILVRRKTALRNYERVCTMLERAVRDQDKDVFEAVEKSLKHMLGDAGKFLDWSAIEWELRTGFVLGMNRVSPETPDFFGAHCPELTVETDLDRYEQLLRDIDVIHELRSHKPGRLDVGDHLTDDVKAKMAQIALDLGRQDGFVYCCFDAKHGGEPVPMVSVGEIRDPSNGFPQDAVVCPECNPPERGSPGRRVRPRYKELQAAMRAPGMTCQSCDRFDYLQHVSTIHLEGVAFLVLTYTCRKCPRAAPVYEYRRVNQETSDALKQNTKDALPSFEPQGEAASTGDLENSIDALRGAVDASLGPMDRPWFTGLDLGRTGPFPDIERQDVAKRILAVLVDHPMCRFTTQQLAEIGIGVKDHAHDKRLISQLGNGRKAANEHLAPRGLVLKRSAKKIGREYAYWLEAL